MNFCDYHFLEGVRIAKYFITVLKILIPVILIILGSVNLSKSLANPDKENLPLVAKKFGISVGSAVIIFFLPTIISIVFSLVTNLNDTLKNFNECIKNANTEYIQQLKEETERQAKENNKKDGTDYEVKYNKDLLKEKENSDNKSDSKTNNGKIIVIDPGHGKSSNSMSDSEKTSAGYTKNNGTWGEWRHFKTGTWGQECQGSGGPTDRECWYRMVDGDRDKEPEITLNISNAAKKHLEEKGYTVRMTRTSNNENPSFTKRASYAFKNNDSSVAPDAQAIICIHSNANNGSSSGSAYISLAGGTFTQKYIPSDYINKSNQLGKTINDEIVSQTTLPAYNSGVINNEAYLILFHKSPVIVAYMEIGFYDNASDLNYLQNNYDKIGKAIADGVEKELN